MKKIAATLKVMATFIVVSFILTTYWGTALGVYHHVDDDTYGGCLVCHDMYGPSGNLALIADCVPWDPLEPDPNPPCDTGRQVVFLDNDGPFPNWDYADGDTIYDGICEVCHTTTKYYRNDGSCPDPPCNEEDLHPDYK